MSETVVGDDAWLEDRVDCSICGPGPLTVLGDRGGAAHWAGQGITSRIVQCQRCGLIFPNPMPRPAHRRDAAYGDVDRYFRHHDYQAKVAAFKGQLEKAERLLGYRGTLVDVGCGRGEFLVAASKSGWQSVGVELSERFAEFARSNGANVVQGTLEECRFPSASFDFAVLAAVLEHVYDPLGLLREIRRVLKPRGVLYIDVPNEEALYFVLGNLYQRLRRRTWVLNLSPTFEPFHVFGFSPRSLRLALRKSSFQVMSLWTAPLDSANLPTSMWESRLAAFIDRIGAAIRRGAHMEAWARTSDDVKAG